MDNKIYFSKENSSVIIPSKRAEDGAFDIYANFEEEFLIIEPHETKLIPTGLRSAFSSDYVALLRERGSTGTKGIGQRAGVIDSGYRGLWFVPITNHNCVPLVISKHEDCFIKMPHILYPYSKAIAQCVMVEVPNLTIKEISPEAIMKFESKRGTGCLGASGK